MVAVAQLVRASACGAEGRRFESGQPPHFSLDVITPREFLLAALASEKAPFAFEKFMEAALLHPDFGYYSKKIQDIGKEGDFSTTATMDKLLGQAIGKWVCHKKHENSFGQKWNLIEIGAGNGNLAQTILKSIPWMRRRKLHYHIVEASPILMETQKRKLGKLCHWHTSMPQALAACNGQALIFSNELVDAFPCRVFEWDGFQWKEVALELVKETLREILVQTTPLPASTTFEILDPQPGQRIEIHESYRTWFRSWIKNWKNGSMLTIDYGEIQGNLYHRRPNGTLRAYRQHQQIVGPQIYHNMGQQDITADVNFSDLQNWASELGCQNTRLETQREFIQRFLPDSVTLKNSSPSAQFILHPEGAGSAFKVLEQKRW